MDYDASDEIYDDFVDDLHLCVIVYYLTSIIYNLFLPKQIRKEGIEYRRSVSRYDTFESWKKSHDLNIIKLLKMSISATSIPVNNPDITDEVIEYIKNH